MARSGDWQVGPNVKPEPGSQGTLFRGGSQYMRSGHFHRGYTPERQAEIREAVKPSHFGADDSQHYKIVDTIARSTAPAEHLENLEWAVAKKGEAITSAEARGEESIAGAHFPSRVQLPKEGAPGGRTPSLIAVKEQHLRAPTVLHELGHHASEVQQNPWRDKYSYESAAGGHEEAFADNYAETHFRDKKGRQQDQGIYGGGKWAGRIQRSDEFWGGYGKNRSYDVRRAEVAAEDEKFYQAYPEERQWSGGAYEEPLITKSYVSKEDMEKRGERPEMNINSAAMPVPRWY